MTSLCVRVCVAVNANLIAAQMFADIKIIIKTHTIPIRDIIVKGEICQMNVKPRGHGATGHRAQVYGGYCRKTDSVHYRRAEQLWCKRTMS